LEEDHAETELHLSVLSKYVQLAGQLSGIGAAFKVPLS
jgi:hypothetical protein